MGTPQDRVQKTDPSFFEIAQHIAAYRGEVAAKKQMQSER
jgi:hypothetical protein